MSKESNNPSIETLKRIDAICDQYESALRNGDNPDLGVYLKKVPQNEHPLLFKDLVEIKLELHKEDSFDGIEEELTSQFADEKATISHLIREAKSRKIQQAEETKKTKQDKTDSEIPKNHPQKIDQFEILKVLGEGGFGTVYKAKDTQLGRTVALKVPLESTIESRENLKRFIREGRIAAGLHHTGICPIYEVKYNRKIPYIVMKYIDGPTMSQIHKQMVKNNQLMNILKSLNLIIKIGEAVEFANQKGIIHRDLKPANIIWDKEANIPIVTDFGLARFQDTKEEQLTVSGQGLGTPAYIAPEQAQGLDNYGPQVDVYSLGVIFYELICGQRPVPGKHFDVVIQKSAEDPPSPSTHRSEIDPQLDAICLKAIARFPENRFQTVKKFINALKSYRDGDDMFMSTSLISQEADDEDFSETYEENSIEFVKKLKESFDDDFDPYYHWLAITSKARPVSHYRLLGISSNEQNREFIHDAAERQKMNVREFKRDATSIMVMRILYEIEEARFIILDEDYRPQYDAYMREKKKKASWKRRYQKWRIEVLKNSELPKEYIYITQSSGIVEEFLMIFSIILVGFGLMAWFSFSSWPKPGEKNKQNNVVNVPVKKKPAAPDPAVLAKLEKDRLAKIKAAQDLKDKLAKAKAARDKIKADKLAKKKADQDKKAKEEEERLTKEKAEREKIFDISKLELTEEWTDLLPSLDVVKNKLQGDLQKNNGVLTAGIYNKKSNILNSFNLPVNNLQSYELEIEGQYSPLFKSQRKSPDAYLVTSLPVANKRCQLRLDGDSNILTQILNQDKRSHNMIPYSNNGKSEKGKYDIIKNGHKAGTCYDKNHTYKNVYKIRNYNDNGRGIKIKELIKYKMLFTVKYDDTYAMIQIRFDGRLAMDWAGLITDIADVKGIDHWNNHTKNGIAIATKSMLYKYYQVRIRKLKEQKISIPESTIKSPYVIKEPKPIRFYPREIKKLQKETALKHNTDVNMTNTIGMELKFIPPGKFIMGSPRKNKEKLLKEYHRNWNELAHPVQISKPFYMGTYEVTRGQFRQFIEEVNYKTETETNKHGGWGYNQVTNKYVHEKKYSWKDPGFSQNDNHPVVNVSWNDGIAFCKWLSKKEKKTYRLPTEAEWEYSCRAGTANYYHFKYSKDNIIKYANLADGEYRRVSPNGANWGEKKSDGYAFTAPVGSYKPNAFGLFDTHGNVMEWCHDTMIKHAYYLIEEKTAIDPHHMNTPGTTKIHRGGSWYHGFGGSSAAFREAPNTDQVDGTIGFRIVREISEKD